MDEKAETIDNLINKFSREIFDKASKSFLKKNLIIPLNIENECLYVVTTVGSNLDQLESLNLVYSAKSITKVDINKKDFELMYDFCFESQRNSSQTIDKEVYNSDEHEKKGEIKKHAEEVLKNESKKSGFQIGNDNNSNKTISNKRLVNPIIVASVIVALAISFIGYKIYLNLEIKYAEEEFSSFVKTVSGKMIKLAIDSESIIDEINTAWREAIFSDYNKRDFNIAIRQVVTNRYEQILSIKKLSDEISKDIIDKYPPAGKENEYKRLKELYLLFNKYANMAILPSGSLQTYSEQNSKLTVEIKSGIKELEMMK